jgi:hypothetical protein
VQAAEQRQDDGGFALAPHGSADEVPHLFCRQRHVRRRRRLGLPETPAAVAEVAALRRRRGVGQRGGGDNGSVGVG